jgi:hypothetical protein
MKAWVAASAATGFQGSIPLKELESKRPATEFVLGLQLSAFL